VIGSFPCSRPSEKADCVDTEPNEEQRPQPSIPCPPGNSHRGSTRERLTSSTLPQGNTRQRLKGSIMILRRDNISRSLEGSICPHKGLDPLDRCRYHRRTAFPRCSYCTRMVMAIAASGGDIRSLCPEGSAMGHSSGGSQLRR
jgi:hypothetical protein